MAVIKHGLHGIRLYRIWQGMKNRCRNPNMHNWSHYGGKGVTVCAAWQEFMPFYTWAMANGYSDDLQLDRINGKRNYSPRNCRWATVIEQQQNRTIVKLTPTKAQKIRRDRRNSFVLAKIYNVHPSTIRDIKGKRSWAWL